jgi:hypothetical protein
MGDDFETRYVAKSIAWASAKSLRDAGAAVATLRNTALANLPSEKDVDPADAAMLSGLMKLRDVIDAALDAGEVPPNVADSVLTGA